MNKMDLPSVERAVEVYRECASSPTLSSATLQKTKDGVFSIHSTWSHRDLERQSNIKYTRTHIVMMDKDGSCVTDVIDPGTSTELNSEQSVRWSPSGKYKAVLRKVMDKKGDEKQYIEVWHQVRKVNNINLTALEKHGKVNEDGEFGCLEWSSCESKLLYVAEKKQPKAVSFFEKQKEAGSDKEEKDPKVQGDQFVYRQDWGELLVGKHWPVPCILDLSTEQVTVLEGLPENVSVGQAVWTPDGNGIVFAGWDNEPYRVGMIYCKNRRSAIYYYDISSKQCEAISVIGQSVRSPVFSPDGSKLVYLQNRLHGPHMQCAQLIVCEWSSTREKKVVVDIVQTPTVAAPFPGLYVLRFGSDCWLDNDTILTSSVWRSGKVILAVNITTGEVKRLNGDDGAYTFCAVREGLILAYWSSPVDSGHLVLGIVSKSGVTADMEWRALDSSCVVIPGVAWSIMKLKPAADGLEFEAIVYQPKVDAESSRKLPLIMWPHGGPHSSFTLDYLLFVGAFSQLGFVVTLVNYRGSLGFGQGFIDSLPGFVGTNDVQDVQLAAEEVLKLGLADPDRVAVSGGSHGGFLSTHMIGQYPDFYKACIVRNPVTNIAAMMGGTDIKSWTMTEAGFDFDFDRAPSPEMYAKMFNCSPMAHIDKVKAPTLLMLGSVDLRVPPQQGLRYHELLKARGVKTRLLMYPDNSHPISKVDAEADCFMNMYKWIAEHI